MPNRTLKRRLSAASAVLILSLTSIIAAQQATIPLASLCEADSSPVFLLHHNTTKGIRLRSIPASSFIECSEYCSTPVQAINNDCVGVEYSSSTAQCHIIGASEQDYQPQSGVHPHDSGASGSPLITKSCVKSQRICASPFHFDVHEQKILVGFAREVVPAESIQVCLSACLNAFDTFGFECESLMYYPVDAECILNTEDRLDRPDLFVDEHEDTVIYMDNNCAGSQCYAPYVTQYVTVEGKQLSDELDRVFPDLDLGSCEELCTQRLTITANDFNCKSFMYNPVSRQCILSDERSKPLGRANLTEAIGFNYYEKKCFASPRTCRNTPSFTRVPQMLLVGFAAFVMENVPSVTMCLDQCTNPPPETGEKFVCKSAMYYYNEQECILNAESRRSKPDLFIPEEDDFVVDYFDINCRLEAEQCASDAQLHTVRTLNAALPEGDGSLHVIESTGTSVSDCTQKCYSMAPEKCRSFNFDKQTGVCNMLYLDGKTAVRPQVKPGVDFYDLHCLHGPANISATSSGCLSKDGSIYSRYLYTKQSGVASKEEEHPAVALSKCLELCTSSAQCEGVNYNRRNGDCQLFEKVDTGAGQRHDQIDFYKNLCAVREVDTGVSSAANVPKEPTALKSSGNRTSSAGGSFAGADGSEGAVIGGEAKKIKAINAGRSGKKGPIFKEEPVVRKSPADTSPDPPQAGVGASLNVGKIGDGANVVPPVLIPAGAVHTICNYEGIKVQIKHKHAFSGVVFAKNKYDTCRVEVDNSDSATLVLGLPANFGMKPIRLNSVDGSSPPAGAGKATSATHASNRVDSEVDKNRLTSNEIRRRRQVPERECGLIDMDNGTYKTTVVVQTNNLGIPGLVTSMDQLYEISCNYSSMLGGKITAASNLTVHGPQPSLIQPRGKIELGNPVLMQMGAISRRDSRESGHGQVQAKLGDILELRWEIMAMDQELDFLVKDCYAEPGASPGSVGGHSERLQLIKSGCPTPAVAQKLIQNPIQVQSSSVKVAHMQAFRFDSSATVRITCHLELCQGTCKPATCFLGGLQKESWGRKKRELPGKEITEFETKRYKVPRYAQATTSLVIVDPLQHQTPVNDPSSHISLSKHSGQELVAAQPKYRQADVHKAPVVPAPFWGWGVGAVRQQQLGQTCMNKWGLMGVLGTLFALILVQFTVVSRFIFKRILSESASTASVSAMTLPKQKGSHFPRHNY